MSFTLKGLTVLDRELTPFGELTLERVETDCGDVAYQICLDRRYMMGSHGSHGERGMAMFAHGRLKREKKDLDVLIGGLGAGHTLRAVLDLPGVARVVVAEIGSKVLEWNRRYFAPFNGNAVDDPRVEVRVGDVLKVMENTPGAWDLLLIDVDNGPGWLATPANARLYDVPGVRVCRDALRPGGVLAFWSPCANPQFFGVMNAVFGAAVEEVRTTELAREVGETVDVIYLAVRGVEAHAP